MTLLSPPSDSDGCLKILFRVVKYGDATSHYLRPFLVSFIFKLLMDVDAFLTPTNAVVFSIKLLPSKYY